jgi:hypothetical protein
MTTSKITSVTWVMAFLGMVALLVSNVQAQVAGDECATAIDVTDGLNKGTTVGATTSPDIEACTNGAWQQHRDLWFRYQATCNGVLTVSTCGTSFDTQLALYRSSDCGLLGFASCNDDAFANTTCTSQSIVHALVSMNEVSYIRMGGYSETNFGPYKLTLDCRDESQTGASELPSCVHEWCETFRIRSKCIKVPKTKLGCKCRWLSDRKKCVPM